jgi:hypothetical protein
LGGAYGLSTATTRHHSSSILKRIGGAPLRSGGKEIPPYYDPYYGCDMELLRFDSTAPNPRYTSMIEESCDALREIPVIATDLSASCSTDLISLHGALTGNSAELIETGTTGDMVFTPA